MKDAYQHNAKQHEQKVLLMFGSVLKALEAEKVLKAASIPLELLVPPVEFRTGCDLAVGLEDYDAPAAFEALEAAKLTVIDQRVSAQGAAQLSTLVTAHEFLGVDGKHYLMVRSGNMKITVERASGLIVNTSGGGCPDIPYLNIMLVGHTLADAPHPRTLGKTLCGMMLERAFDEAVSLCGFVREGDDH